ncbi:MAG TPA: PAS domain-containing protein [Candidatus Limnocylindrales bacterium]|nr:PAS domain-containing protein [Candidatus Limnocylindrales bacterium]
MTANDKVNILMVDDQPAKLLSYEAILGELSENLIKAGSGREALEVLLKTDVAVVLMDVSMPEMDGFEMAEIIRQHPRFQKTAIIFISGVHLSDIDRLKGYERGAVDYISVPVVPEVLRAKVSVFAELHRKTRMLEALNRDLEQRVTERTEELRESEIQFRTLANSIPQLAWMANPDGTVFWYNQRWFDYTGTTLADVENHGWKKVHHPGHVTRVTAGIERCWRTGEEWEDTCPLRGHDGQYRWFLSRAVPIRDSHGKVVRWFGTSTDISRQIAAEEQIRRLNDELRQRLTELETIMQVLPVGVVLAQDPECKVITCNAALSGMLGVPAGSNISRSEPHGDQLPFEIFYEGRAMPPDHMPVQRAATTGKAVGPLELEIRLQNGRVYHMLASASPLFNEAGEVRGAVGALMDVSARKTMENTLRERADLLELASEAVMVRDSKGALHFWNSGAEALYGWKRNEVLGRNVHDVLQTRYPKPIPEIDSVIREEHRWDGNLLQSTKDGREVIVASRQALKLGNDSGDGTILEINRDITAQLSAEEALRKTERLAAMGRVAGIIAHEINNPLEAITNAFYLLRDHPSLDGDARAVARMAEEELLRVAHITRQTLSFYRESQQAVAVSVCKVVDDVLELQARRLRLSGIELEKRYFTEGLVYGFPSELKQVFLNLVGNAIQAMPEGGRLRLRVAEHKNGDPKSRGVLISVCDTGSGIKPEDAKHLFEPFFTTKSTKGTGLGLWISKGIIQKYDGMIRFRSVSIGGRKATCFSVFLPGSNGIHAAAPLKVQEAIGSR